ncbi:gliding motility-associated C-terminal domain-containing protein [Flavobacterium sp. CYK-55]|uniref:fibronectin type III domain-containing protein n=1 Tax=Flavobacterium sp. CYK-55 TaxID=2835529 RepID=UPI001BD0B700|nr:gliding motility-associated C-terminal domain-containing protein [Flavobacterium sp. CYK-55]MBS7786114.1 gliding motility-associated C-terminal domain-containing protein [Flavobacterium sp. CYK-55]
MKKLILFFFVALYSLVGQAQLNEGFEGAPAAADASGIWALTSGNWLVRDNRTNTGQNWKKNVPPHASYQGTDCAFIDRENTGQGVLAEEWLISPLISAIPASSQFRFFTRQTLAGDTGTKYQIRVSSSPNQDDLASFTVLQEYTETQLSTLTADQLDYEEKIINLTFTGSRYFAFVKVFTQPGAATSGDRWLVDNVRIIQRCPDPSALSVVTPIQSTSATLQWTANAGINDFDVIYGPSGFDPEAIPSEPGVNTITGINSTTTPRSYNLTGLTPGTNYQYYVRSVCPESTSIWVGPYLVPTPPQGALCSDPIPISNLPYQSNSNTLIYGDNISTTGDTPGSSCGTTGAFLASNDVVYSYQNNSTDPILLAVSMNPLGSTNTGVFVYGSCSSIGTTCLGGVANANSSIRNLTVPVAAGQTVYVLLSSTTATTNFPYTLIVQQANCVAPINLSVPSFTTTSANLSWSNGTSSTSTAWEVAVQPAGALIPSGPGVLAVTNSNFPVTTQLDGTPLAPATQYQYWVRADCGSGLYSAWSGPFLFNTDVCEAVNKCNYTFVLTTSTGNGWKGAIMQIRQAGIVVGSIGPTFTTGLGPVNVTVPLCNALPFDLVWTTAGTNANSVRLLVKNSFDQPIYSITSNSGSQVGNTLLTKMVDCLNPECQRPTGVQVPTATIFTTSATVNWTTSGIPTTGWEIYLVLSGQPAPTDTTIPTYTVPGTDPTSFEMGLTAPFGPLTPDTLYDVYIRSVCSVDSPSDWTSVTTFRTIPTCFRPTAVAVTIASVTTTTAPITWTNGQPTDTQWQVLLIPAVLTPQGPTAPAAPGVIPPSGNGELLFDVTAPGSPFTATGLQPATIYYVYVRTVCSASDSSVWQPATIPSFNTVTCDPAAKCNYKFLLSNTTGNTWNGGRMLVRQNGITVATLGANQINNAAGVTVALCPGVPFDLYWSVAGTAPDLIGVTVVNPFLDVLYTKLPAEGAPLTVLYSGTGNCTPAPCSKPTGMTAVTTSNSALLTWTDNSVPPSQSFDLYVVPTGQPAPTNIPPTPPTISGIIGTSYNLTQLNSLPLTPSTSYTYYVKAICADPDSSAWTVLTPLTFVTKPVNDECLTATPVPINAGQTCGITVAGNTFGATASLPILSPPLSGTGCGQPNNDVWYSFVATATSHSINLTDLVGTPAAATLHHSVFSGDCNNLVKLYCSTALNSGATGLTIGNTYYIRVYNSNTTAGQSVAFNICITSPPANDECIGALDVPVNPDQVCALQTAGNTLGATPSLPTLTGTGCTGNDDDVWFKFTATNAIHMIEIKDLIPTPASATVALNHTLFSGDCGTLTNIYCSNLPQSVATGLVIGQTYYIRVYTNGTTAGQSATFNVCIKTPPPPATNDECANAIPVAVNLTAVCTLTTPGNIIGATASLPAAATCQGNSNDDVWFSFVATSTTHFISLLNVEGTTTNLNHAVYSGTCGALTLKYCSAANSLTSNNATFVVGQTYYIRVWSNEAASQVTTFNLCVKSISTCENAAPFCGSSPTDPYIFENTTGITSTGQIACLGSNPNPTFYTLHVGQTGPLYFNILQNTAIDAAGNPTGQNLDVDFVAWGPFTSTESCDQIAFVDCPTCPFDNFPPNNSTFYPLGNIIDCSYSASFTETLSIPNAQQGEFYVILITNFNGAAGFIKLVQTNFGEPASGETICCGVDLGSDESVCDTSITLNALEGVVDLNNVPGTYQWYYNGSTTPIPGENGPTITVNQSGTYRVTGACGLNEVEDTIIVTFNVTPTPEITITQPTCENLLGSIEVTAPTGGTAVLPSDLYISEITDAETGSLTYVEIFNGTGAAVNLSNYKLKVYNNGNATASCDLALSGTINNNTTNVIKLSTDVNQPGITPNQTFTTCGGVNIDDNIKLTTSADVVVDNWGTSDGSAFTPSNQPGYVYRRNQLATAPNTGWNPADWTAIDPEDYSNIGTYVASPTSGYQYNVDNGSWQNETSFTGLSVGSHTVYVRDVNTGCISSFTFDITPSNVNQPVTSCSYPATVCITDPNPTNSFTGLTPNGQFSSDSAQLVIDQNTGEINLAASQPGGPYNITYSFAGDLANCIAPGSTTVQIVVTPLAVPTFTQLGPICAGTTSPVFVNTSNEGIVGTWNPPTISNTASDTYTFTPDAGQCADIATMTIQVTTENITPIFDPIPAFCEGTTAPSLPSTSNNGITGVWVPATVSNTASDTYTFTPDPGQCGVVAQMTITVTPPSITPSFTQIPSFCEGTTAPSLPATSNDGITGTWNPATVSNTATGIYTFTPDAGQCALPVDMTITVTPPSITPSFTQIPSFCEGTTAPSLPATSNDGITGTWNPATVSNTATGIYTFTPDAGQCALPVDMTITVTPPSITPSFTQIASFCEGTTAPSLPATSNDGITGTWNPATVSNTATGIYTFTPDAGQCALPVDMTITVTPPNITPTFIQIADICSGSVAPSLPTASIEGISGTWNPSIVDNNNTTTYQFTPNAGQCAVGQTMTITVNPTLTPNFAAIPPICEGSPIPTLDSMSPNGIPGVWSPATITESGTYTFSPAPNVCALAQSIEVTIVPKPVFTVDGGCIGSEYTLTVSPQLADAIYVWKDETGTVIAGENSSTLVVSQTGNYTCEVTVNGCSGSEIEPVTTISCLIQKGISPKGTGIGDGKNDYFDLEGFNVSKLQIFNRYGAVVYSKTRYVNEWYGQSDNGDELPDGTYFYVIDIDGQKSKSGWIYINHEQ